MNAITGVVCEDVDTVLARAVEAHAAGVFDSAVADYHAVLAIEPKNVMALTNLGVLAFDRREYHEAIDFHTRALACDAENFIAQHNLGCALNGARFYSSAREAYLKALDLEPEDPRTHCNLGDTLIHLGQYEVAIEHLRHAIWLKPDFAEAYTNLGKALLRAGQVERAIAFLRLAISLDPDLAMAHKNLGIALLCNGQFLEGWTEYGWRFPADDADLKYNLKVWDGEIHPGKLAVWLEQGLGDEILQAGMLGDLQNRGLQIVCDASERLLPLLRQSYPNIEFHARKPSEPTRLDEVDKPNEHLRGVTNQLPGGSIGFFCRRKSEDFPKQTAYLQPDPERVESLRAQMDLEHGERLVGVSWASFNERIGKNKSIDLSEWNSVLQTPGARFVDLQYGCIDRKRGWPLMVLDLDLTNDLDGVAALISLCDAIVTVSNTVAHLAGALGVRTYVLMPSDGLELWWAGRGETTPWYPNTRIIRKAPEEPWSAGLGRAQKQLDAFLQEKDT